MTRATVNPNDRPSCLPKQYNREFAAGEILLVPNVLVRCQQQIEARTLGRVEQFAVLERRPTLLSRRPNRVTRKELAERNRRPLIEQNEHYRPAAD